MNTPLRNLFSYIKELYSSTQPVLLFDEQQSKAWQAQKDYFTLDYCLDLYNLAQLEANPNINVQYLTTDEPLLQLQRTVVPPLNVPAELMHWHTITQPFGTLMPVLQMVEQHQQTTHFDDDKQRVLLLNLFEQQLHQYTVAQQLHQITDDLPQALQQWVKPLWHNEQWTLEVQKTITKTIHFDDEPKRIAAYKKFEKQFAAYQLEHHLNNQINQLYDQLHTLYYELKQQNNQQLYLSFGLVTGRIANQLYRNFLFYVPLQIVIKQQQLHIDFDDVNTRILAEQHLTYLLEQQINNPNNAIPPALPKNTQQQQQQIFNAIDNFNQQNPIYHADPAYFNQNFIHVAEQILQPFGAWKNIFWQHNKALPTLDTTYYPTHDANQISLSFSPIIQIKNQQLHQQVAKDAHNIVRKIDELQQNKELHLIPPFFTKLFQQEAFANAEKLHESSQPLPPTPQQQHTTNIQQPTFYFPLPYNQEQLAIAQQLQADDALTVKGPPGTGKSHTIANLISHYVAHGKNVLVVSQNSKALQVVHQKLPTAIQPMAISLLANHKANNQLKTAVNTLISQLSKPHNQQQLDHLQQQLDQLQQHYQQTLQHIAQAIQSNHHSTSIYDPTTQQLLQRTAYQWAQQYYTDMQHIPKLPDTVLHHTNTQTLAHTYQTWQQLTHHFVSSDYQLPQYTFLPDTQLIPLATVQQQQQQQQHILTQINLTQYQQSDYQHFLPQIAPLITNYIQQLQQLPAHHIAWQVLPHPSFDQAQLQYLIDQNTPLQTQLNQLNTQLLAYQFNTEPLQHIDPTLALQQLQQLINKFDQQTTLTLLQRTFLSATLKNYLQCTVNGLACTQLSQLHILQQHFQQQHLAKQLHITFNNYFKQILNTTNELPAAQLLPQLQAISQFARTHHQLNQQLNALQQASIPLQHAYISQQIQQLQHIVLYAQYVQLQQQSQQQQQQLLHAIQAPQQHHPLLYQLAQAVLNHNSQQYAQLLAHYQQLRSLQPTAQQAAQLFELLFAQIPLTITQIQQQQSQQPPQLTPISQLQQQLYKAQISHYLHQQSQHLAQIEQLIPQIQQIQTNIQHKTTEVISYRAWFYKQQQITEYQKSALSAWLANLIAFGKGYGKNAQQQLNNAVQNMQLAQQTVPVWIMQQSTALTFFHNAQPAQFDLLIIDEASQCDISALNIIFRAKKTLIVGDENQTNIAPNTQIFTHQRTNHLLDTHLAAHPFKNSFNVTNNNSSIYTLSSIIYPNIISLTEHFRCQPQIIGYANQYIYQQQIVPLKTSFNYLYGAPTSIEYIACDINEKQPTRQPIIDRALQIIIHYIDQYQQQQINQLPTVGILSLNATNQKHQTALLNQLLQHPKIQQHEQQLNLLIGTSREFQGDERDLMILTITTTHYYNQQNELRPPRALFAEEYMRNYNVASTRARERCIVLHAILPQSLSLADQNCYRVRLLQYYQQQQHQTLHQYAPSSQTLPHIIAQINPQHAHFATQLITYLHQHCPNTQIIPNLLVAHYQIDVALINPQNKIALMLDGTPNDQTTTQINQRIQQQLTLQRADWQFVRLQSTQWYYNNEDIKINLLKIIQQ